MDAARSEPKPESILWFDRCFVLTLAINLVSIMLSLPRIEAMIAADPVLTASGIGAGFLVTVSFSWLLVLAFVWFLVSRLRSNAARWVLGVFIGLHVLTSVLNPTMLGFPAIELVFVVAGLVTGAASAAFLFLPDAGEWFAR